VCWGYHCHDKLTTAGANILVHSVDELDKRIDEFLNT
jgi:hypothetical protein